MKILNEFYLSINMSNQAKRIVILNEVELRKTLSRLTSEIIE